MGMQYKEESSQKFLVSLSFFPDILKKSHEISTTKI